MLERHFNISFPASHIKSDNTGSTSVHFGIIVTPDSIIEDVIYFYESGAIRDDTLAELWQEGLEAAGITHEHGRCIVANSLYRSFIRHLTRSSGTLVDPFAVDIMIEDTNDLIDRYVRTPPSRESRRER